MIAGAGIRPSRGLLVGGMALLALATSWPFLLPSGTGSSVDTIDFVRGAIFGVGMGLELLAVWTGRRQGGAGH